MERRYKIFLLVMLGMFAAFASLINNTLGPVLKLVADTFQASDAVVGLGLTASMAGLAAGQLIIGPLSDKYGRRTPVIVSVGLFALSSLAIVFSPSITIFIVLRFVQGLGGAGGIVISRSIATDNFKGRDLMTSFAIVNVINGIAPIVAPAASGAMASMGGWQAVFVMLAVVGSRRCTRDGQRAAREFAQGLAENGVTVVSGMARGIDSCAHRGALDGGGQTIAVLGCGVDIVYPPENDRLMAEILDSGGAVISEYLPGTPPAPGNFPARNRIISGLSEGTLLVEGAKASGAMITVNFALEQGRDVFAVPGSIYSPLSATPNRMILEGAFPALCHWDILEHYRWAQRPGEDPRREAKPVELDADEAAIVEPLREQALTFDELSAVTGFPAAKLNSHLTILELRGIIEKVPGGQYRSYA